MRKTKIIVDVTSLNEEGGPATIHPSKEQLDLAFQAATEFLGLAPRAADIIQRVVLYFWQPPGAKNPRELYLRFEITMVVPESETTHEFVAKDQLIWPGSGFNPERVADLMLATLREAMKVEQAKIHAQALNLGLMAPASV